MYLLINYHSFPDFKSSKHVLLSKYSKVNTPLLNYSLIPIIYFLILGGIPFSLKSF